MDTDAAPPPPSYGSSPEADGAPEKTPLKRGESEIEDEVVLKKELNLISASAVVAGVVIGSGIFISPVSIMANCGSFGLSLVMWLLSGLLCMSIAFCYAELASMFPGAGGEYTYYQAVFGPFAAFLQAWVVLIIRTPVFYAILALTTSAYTFKPFLNDCDAPEILLKIFSCWLIISIVAINCISVKLVARVQVVFTVVKVLALIFITIVGIVYVAKGNVQNFEKPFEGSNLNFGAMAVSMYTGVYNYDGWVYMFFLMEEITNPLKNIPRATVISMTMVIVLYLLTNTAYSSVLTIPELIGSNAVAIDFAARTVGPFVYVMPLLVASSTLGALNGAILGGSRVSFAAARDKLFPKMFSMLHVKYTTPVPSIWLSCIIAMIYVVSGEVLSLLEYLGFILLVTYTTSVGCVLWLKWREPHRPRPLKVSLFVCLPTFLVMVGLVILGVYEQPQQNVLGILMMGSGLPLYWLCVVWKGKPKKIESFMSKLNILVQKTLLVEPTHKVN